MQLSDSTESFALKKTCSRFSPIGRALDDKDAIIYLKLRETGCGKKSAHKFVRHTICKTDVTKAKDGPAKHKTLVVKKDTLQVANNGWKVFDPVYNLGEGQFTSVKEILVNNYENELFKSHFTKHESRIQEDFKKKIHVVKNYYDEIKNESSLLGLNKHELIRKLNNERDRAKSATGSTRIKVDRRDIQFHVPTIAMKHLDEDINQALNLLAQGNVENGYLRPALKVEEEPQINTIEELDGTQGNLGSSKFTSLSIIPTEEDQVEEVVNYERQSTIDKRIKPLTGDFLLIPEAHHEAEETARGNSEIQLDKKISISNDVHKQSQNLASILDAAPDGLMLSGVKKDRNNKRKKTQEFFPKPQAGASKYLSKNKELAEEFNTVNYLFGDITTESKNDLSVTSPFRRSGLSPNVKRISTHTSLVISNNTSYVSLDNVSKDQDKSKPWDFRTGLEEVNKDILEAKKKEVSQILDRYRKKLEPLAFPNPIKTRITRASPVMAFRMSIGNRPSTTTAQNSRETSFSQTPLHASFLVSKKKLMHSGSNRSMSIAGKEEQRRKSGPDFSELC